MATVFVATRNNIYVRSRRTGLTEIGFTYVVGVQSSIRLRRARNRCRRSGRPPSLVRRRPGHAPVSAKEMAQALFGLSKRGDRYLRTLRIHGARAALGKAAGKQHSRSLWLSKLLQRKHSNVAAVALANKNARIVWAMLSGGTL